MRKLFTLLVIVVTTTLFLATSSVNAQIRNKNGIAFYDFNLKLQKGKMTTLSNKRFKELDSHSYHFTATKGQHLYVQLTSKAEITFIVYQITKDPEGDKELGSAGDEDWSWNGELPDTGDYRILVREIFESTGKKNGTYTLKVKLD